jgi:serine/threonine protein kinase
LDDLQGNGGGEGVAEGELTPKEVGGFRILRRLASGATSDVLLARAEGPHGFQRVVALKILLTRVKGSPDFERNFATEASAYARLSHPAVVKLYDFFSADAQLVMVLEYVDGLPLHKLRAMLASAGERIDDKAAIFLGLRVFSALAAAHGARDPARGEFAPVVHFDVNPSNILVPWDGQVKLGDFGIARAAGVQSDARSGFIKGTYGYIAPEQVGGSGGTGSAVDRGDVRSDVYSAGLILWELLARRKAVQRGVLNDAQVLKAMQHPEFPALELLRPDLDAALRGAIKRALEPDPAKRTITAEEMVSVLRQAVTPEDGRKALAAALARIRPAGGPGDPLATTATSESVSPPAADARAKAVATDDRLDPEETGTYSAITEETGDLGKIAFYGRIKLPDGGEPAKKTSATPPPLPPPTATPPVAPVKDELAATAETERLTPDIVAVLPADASPLTPARAQPATPALGAVPRAVPRPAVDTKRISAFPAPTTPLVDPPASPLVADPAPADAASTDLAPADVSPSTALTPLAPPVAESAPALSAVAVSPMTERSPEPPLDAASPPALPVSSGHIGASATTGSVRPNAPPYVLSSLPPAAPRRFPWGVVVAVGALLAVGGGYVLLGGSGDVATAPSAAPVRSVSPPGSPSSGAPVSASGVAAVAPSASPSASSPAAAASAIPTAEPRPAAAPSASVAAAGSAGPPASVVASAAPPVTKPSGAVPASAALAAAAPPSGPVPADSGDIVPPASAAGHRVFVDGKVGGEGTAPIRVHCGSHDVKVGSAGAEKKVDVPCGGTLTL